MMKLKYIIKETDINKSLNDILKKEFNFSTRLFSKLIKNNLIKVNGDFVDTRNLVNINDVIEVDLGIEEDNSNIVPNKMNFKVLYEDEWLLIVGKSAGIPVHPSCMHYDTSLSNGIKKYFDDIGLKKKIRPVNRLDLNTSGIVVFAKCEYIQEELIRQMENNTFKKEYLCLVNGFLDTSTGTISLPIARKEGSIIEREINENGKISITHYEVIKKYKDYSLVKCILETGRTHQIRVHMKAIGHPLLGDTLYGNTSNIINRQALHSYKVTFIHPITKNTISIVSNVPSDFKIEME